MNTQHLMEGVVVDTGDPQQMGRVKIWVPAVDGDIYKIQDLPWATYMSPMAGQTRDYPAGPDSSVTPGFMSYGWVSVPKTGALVIVGFLYGDPNRRVYMGSYFRDHGNRSLPAGRVRPDLGPTPLSDTFDPVQPQTQNLNLQFNKNLTASEAVTRGAVERNFAKSGDVQGDNGYSPDLVKPTDDDGKAKQDPQTHVLTTPGRHALIFQDNPKHGRVRLKTAAGHQIILDDANERIYVSTARGNTWLELDQDGRVHLYGADSVSVSTGGDFNVTAKGSINMNAGKDVNIQAGAGMQLASCAAMNISGSGVNLESSAGFNILAAGKLLQTASGIHLNGPTAGGATCPTAPTTIPTHEPWTRAPSKGPRNRNYKA